MIDYLNGIFQDFLAEPGSGKVWMAVGFCGNLVFFSRFLVQWIVSEQHQRSVIPVAFWYLSLAGTWILLSYALYRREPIFILAYLPNSLIYLRNLRLIYRRKGREASQSGENLPSQDKDLS